MAEIINNENYVSSKVLMDNLDPILYSYFDDHIYDTEFSNYFYEQMSSWFLSKPEMGLSAEVTLFNVVYFVFEQIISQYDDSNAAYNYFFELHRSRRNYFFKIIKDEYTGKPSPRNPMYLHKQADSYFNLLPYDTSLKIYSTKQEYIDVLYTQIQQWRNNPSSRLVEFMYFEKIDEKRRYASFICDIALNLLEIVTKKYYGKYNGGLTVLPKTLVENGIFGYRSTEVPLDISIEEDRAVATNTFTYRDDDDVLTVVDIVMDETTGDFSLYTAEEKDALIKKLRADGALKTSAEDLNARDEMVLSSVYSAFNVNVLTEDWIRMPGRNFVAQTLGKTNLRARDIKGVLKSLEKLASCRIKTEQRDVETGQLKGRGILSFFDIRYGLNCEDSAVTVDLNVPESAPHITDSDDISDEDLTTNKWSIEIAPSALLKEMWRNRVNTEIYTKQYQAITGPKSKSIMMLLQNERLKQYPVSTITMTYTMLKNRLRLSEKNAIVKKEIAAQLELLKTEHIIVKNYTMERNNICIEFLPFTDLERLLYKIDSKDNFIQG